MPVRPTKTASPGTSSQGLAGRWHEIQGPCGKSTTRRCRQRRGAPGTTCCGARFARCAFRRRRPRARNPLCVPGLGRGPSCQGHRRRVPQYFQATPPAQGEGAREEGAREEARLQSKVISQVARARPHCTGGGGGGGGSGSQSWNLADVTGTPSTFLRRGAWRSARMTPMGKWCV